jgi:hypothetical protein
MFFLVIFSTSYYVFANIKGGTAFINKLQSKQLLISPNAEYQNLRENCFYSSLMIDDSRCIVIMKKDSLNKNKIYKTQIMTYKLDLLFSEADYNQNTRRANLIIDEMNAHIFDAKNTIRESNKIIIDRNDILKKLKWDVKLLDTHVYKGPEKAKKILERDEYKDLSLTILKTHDSLLQKDIQQFHTISRKNYDLAKFESNKEYFGNLSSYLSFYDSLFLDSSNIYREINIDTPEHEILLENNYIAKTYRITSPNINLTKSKLIGLEKEYNLREAKSNFIMNIIFLPIDYLMDISDFDDY